MCVGLDVKYPSFFSNFIENLNFSTDFPKALKYQISRKSVRWKPSSSAWTDGQTHRQA